MHNVFLLIISKVKPSNASEIKGGNGSSIVALELDGSETNLESPFQVILNLDNQNNSAGKLSSGDTGKHKTKVYISIESECRNTNKMSNVTIFRIFRYT